MSITITFFILFSFCCCYCCCCCYYYLFSRYTCLPLYATCLGPVFYSLPGMAETIVEKLVMAWTNLPNMKLCKIWSIFSYCIHDHDILYFRYFEPFNREFNSIFTVVKKNFSCVKYNAIWNKQLFSFFFFSFLKI